MKRVNTFAVIHSIPSPYRLHLFRALDGELRRRSMRLEVHFMARGHADRGHWRAAEAELAFEHRFWPDAPLRDRGGRQWHFNPGLVWHLLRAPPSVTMFGGLWDSGTCAMAALLSRSPRRLGWIEGTPENPGKVSGLVGAAKRRLLGRCTHVVVPGSKGRELVRELAHERSDRIVILPNLVDEYRFGEGRDASGVGQMRTRLGIGSEERLAIWPARLVPEKGIVEFLECLSPDILEGWRVVILGEGPLERAVRDAVARRALGERVSLVKAIPYDQMPSVYAAADLFLLPSLADRNPLSVVEALHAGLPVLLSNRVGNAVEALRPGWNGWALDPADANSVTRACSEAFSERRETLLEMGRRSRCLAVRYWTTQKAVGEFLDAVLPGRMV